MEISNKLLSGVLDIDIDVDEYMSVIDGNECYYMTKDKHDYTKSYYKTNENYINIHVLNHKCKLWLIKNEIAYECRYDSFNRSHKYHCKIKGFLGYLVKEFQGDTEFQAVINACEWCLTLVVKDEK